MSVESPRIACLQQWYQTYLADQDNDAYVEKVRQRYTTATLIRILQTAAPRLSRRAAVLALTEIAGYEGNTALGLALSTMIAACGCWPRPACGRFGVGPAARRTNGI